MKEVHTEGTLEKIVTESAEVFDEGVKEVSHLEHELISKKPFRLAKEYWNILGPGLTTGAADDDPSGIATYSQAGAQYGTRFLWLSWMTFPLMAFVQEMCARLGIVKGKGLAAVMREHLSVRVLYFVTALLFLANTFNIGADLGAMAESTQLIMPHIPFAVLVFGFGLLMVLLQLYTTYARYAKYLKYTGLVLFAYIISAFLVHLPWPNVLMHTVVPHMAFNKDEVLLVCGILGTTISPYLFFWQTSQEVEEKHLEKVQNHTGHTLSLKKQISRMRIDVWSGMLFSNAVMFFIIAACAGALFTHGINDITTAREAAEALRPFAGNFASTIFAVGVIGIGLLAVPVLAGSSAYALSESMGWREGLYKKVKQARAFYGVILMSVIIGIALNFTHISSMKLLLYSAIANGIVAPVIIFFIVKLSAQKSIMGEHTNSKTLTFVGYALVFAMVLCALATIYFLFV